jgi:hypothetical protein
MVFIPLKSVPRSSIVIFTSCSDTLPSDLSLPLREMNTVTS